MLSRLRPRSVYDVMAAIACFGVLAGGTAYAASTIGSADIIDESIQSVDLKNGEVKTADIAADAIDSSRVRNGSLTPFDIKAESLSSGRISGLDGSDVDNDGLTGDDVKESSLGQVPSAGWVGYGGVGTSALQYHAVTPDKLSPPEIWHYIGDPGEPAFENGWTNYSPAASHPEATWQHAAYMTDHFGNVHLRGLVAGGTIGQPMFRLGGAACPWFYHALPAISNNALARMTVTWLTDSHNCLVYAETGSNAWISLDGLSWQVSDLEVRTRSGTGAKAVRGEARTVGDGPARLRP